MAKVNYPVQSTALVRIDYDDETSDCFITFKDGRSYTLRNFPQIEAERWANSGSPGGYWNTKLRGKY